MRHYLVTVDGKEFDIAIENGTHKTRIVCNGKEREVSSQILGESRALLLIDNQAFEIDVRGSRYDTQRTVFMKGMEIPATIEDFNLAKLRKVAGIKSVAELDKLLRAAMPGMVLEVKVQPGDTVKKGQPLLIVEAMKMENIIKSVGEGTVKEVFVEKGKSVEKSDKLLEFE